jgi:hypothetical protein
MSMVMEGQGTDSSAKAATERLERQLKWYTDNQKRCHQMYGAIKIAQLVIAATIPVLTAIESIRLEQPWIIAAFGGAIVVLEGYQQMMRYHDNWLRYSVTREALEREKYLYEVHAGPYAREKTHPERLLEEHVEAILAHEIGSWASEEESQQSQTSAGATTNSG